MDLSQRIFFFSTKGKLFNTRWDHRCPGCGQQGALISHLPAMPGRSSHLCHSPALTGTSHLPTQCALSSTCPVPPALCTGGDVFLCHTHVWPGPCPLQVLCWVTLWALACAVTGLVGTFHFPLSWAASQLLVGRGVAGQTPSPATPSCLPPSSYPHPKTLGAGAAPYSTLAQFLAQEVGEQTGPGSRAGAGAILPWQLQPCCFVPA